MTPTAPVTAPTPSPYPIEGRGSRYFFSAGSSSAGKGSADHGQVGSKDNPDGGDNLRSFSKVTARLENYIDLIVYVFFVLVSQMYLNQKFI